MRVALLNPSHLPQVAELERLCFRSPWSENALSVLLGDSGFGLVALTEAGEVTAYLGVMTVLDEGQITNVATHPDHRRKGCAKALLRALFEECCTRGIKELSLEVRESNTAAISLYEKHGFRQAGKRPGFYKNPAEAALVMIAAL
jgi:ribosomal-protein-alanine N-acetyltransferase